MAKRPFFILWDGCDYDGYEYNIRYIGRNREAALARYKEHIENIIREQFIDENCPREQLDISIDSRIDAHPEAFVPGFRSWSYVNDQCDVYWTIGLIVLEDGEFTIPRWEERYKANNPKAKY